MTLPSFGPAKNAAVLASMKGNRRRDTRPELALRSLLHRSGLRFRVDYPIRLPGRVVRPDVVFTRRRLAVFVDGCWWHSCPDHGHRPRSNVPYWNAKLERNIARDQAVSKLLVESGWSVLRLWEHVPPADAVELVRERLEESRG